MSSAPKPTPLHLGRIPALGAGRLDCHDHWEASARDRPHRYDAERRGEPRPREEIATMVMRTNAAKLYNLPLK
jgi:hypothetical protein